jgi:hypothetical protein
MNDSSPSKEYRTSTYWLQLFLWVLACLAAGWSLYKLGNLVIRKPGFWWLTVFEIPLQFSVLVYMFHMIQDFRLSISDGGIRLSMWSRTIYAEWKQVKRVDYVFFQRQLVVEKPVVEKRRAWWLWLDFHKLRSDDSFKLIPFSGWAWEKFDEVEVEVKKRLPHLFEEVK